MHIATLHHLTINFLGREIFRDLTWAIGDRARVGLVGPNGAGKSSLLRAIAGELISRERPSGPRARPARRLPAARYRPAASADCAGSR